ncbi:MAG: Ig-like domain-containing protein [Bacteroidota bacterium]|nr:Ig-like domain-containing protein [Bacteroidota bacterium]
MQKLYTLFIAVLLPFLSQAQIGWNFTTSASPSSGIPVTNIASVSDLTRANNNGTTTLVTTTSASSGYTGATGGGNAGAAARIGALVADTTGSAGSACLLFTLTPASGSSISISEIDFGSRSTSTGPQQYDIRTSLDNYATAVSSAVLLNNSAWALHTNALSLTGAIDQAITVRIYGYNGAGNASASTANWRIDDLAVTATASGGNTPPPAVDPPQSLTATAISSSEIDLTGSGNAAGNNIVVAFNTSPGFGTPSGALTAGNPITGGGTVLYSGPSAGFSLPHTGLSAGTTYFYSAWSVDAGNNYSTAVTASASTGNAIFNVVINQIYGGGGNSGATFKNDFIELFNNENFPVNLSGWSVQYSSAAGSGWASNLTPLSGTIPAHGFFLIQESAGAGGSLNLPTPDLTGTIALSATAGKVILSNSTAAQTGTNPTGPTVIDKVGYGLTATGFETAPTAATDNTTAVVRVTDGADNNNNSTDFKVAAPLPRNSLYTVTPPNVLSLNPPNGDTGVPASIIPAIHFDKAIVKGSGTITLFVDGVAGTPIDVSSASVVISNNAQVTINTPLAGGKSYAIEISPGAFQDIYGNPFAGFAATTSWAFTTFDASVATTLPATFDFQNCIGSGLLPNGFTQFSVSGAQIWDCTAFGRDPNAPAGTAAFPNAVEMNGFANGIDNLNQDWLISPKLDLTGTAFPLLSFWSRNAFAGAPLQLKLSTNYSGSGDPSAATWVDLNGKFPSQGSDIWTLSSNINLSAFKQPGVYIAYVYTSTTDDGSRWSLDDISLINSPTPPPPSLTVGAANLEFGFKAGGTDTTKTLTVTGNDLTSDISLSATGDFLVSADGVHFGPTATLAQATANNVPKTVYVQFAPSAINGQFSGNLIVSISDSTDSVGLKGNSIDPASTLSVVDWNLNWFGTPDPTLGPTDKTLQEQNVGIILPKLHADVYALEEVVNEPALAAIVANMPGYAYVINNYGSHSNITESSPDPLNEVQKLAFVYNTAKVKNIHTDSLLSIGVNTAADVSTAYYNDWASGRFPYMLTADVSLSDNQGGTITKSMHFINIHAKANTAPVVTAYDRRRDGAKALDSLVKADLINDNTILLGDFNDDLNQTITAGIAPPVTSYSSFTTDDSALYIFPTKPLSPSGQHSDVNFTSVIDNVIATKAVAPFYLAGSATVLSDVSSLVSKYGTTTTDHYPVFTQYAFTPPVPIPVQKLVLTGVKEGLFSKLSWTATRTANSKQFIIERSTDGTSFSTIGVVAFKGDSGAVSNYTFYDLLPFLNQMNFYRLKEFGKDGTIISSNVVEIDFGKLSITLTPNPAHGSVNVLIQNAIGPVLLQVLDLNGRLLQQQIVSGTNKTVTLNISRLAPGIYTVRAVDILAVSAQKLMVQ